MESVSAGTNYNRENYCCETKIRTEWKCHFVFQIFKCEASVAVAAAAPDFLNFNVCSTVFIRHYRVNPSLTAILENLGSIISYFSHNLGDRSQFVTEHYHINGLFQ